MFMVRAVGKSRSADHFIDKLVFGLLSFCLHLALNWDLGFLFFSFLFFQFALEGIGILG